MLKCEHKLVKTFTLGFLYILQETHHLKILSTNFKRVVHSKSVSRLRLRERMIMIVFGDI